MRKFLRDNLNRIITQTFLLFFFIVIIISGMFGSISVNAELSYNENNYTDVLTDLQTDESFNADDYPADSSDYSLYVIQIAESENSELFIYVYQPSFALTPLTATQINMSLYEWHTTDESTGNSNASYSLYDLTLISQKGVFQKYKVNNFTTTSDDVRYYDIATIYRAFNADIDEETDDDNTINGIAFEVGKCWAASTDESGNVTYEMQETQVVTITDMHVGYIRYYGGYELWLNTSSYVDGHYIAFSTDYDIDKLYEVDISFITQTYNKTTYYSLYGGTSVLSETYGDEDDTYDNSPLTLTYTDTVTTDVSGSGLLFFVTKSYTWNRIETISDFILDEEDNLTDDTMTAISDMQYAVRFYETEFSESSVTTSAGTTVYLSSTVVSNVSILRLKFEVDGVTYNLGAVSNVQTGDTTPDGTDSYDSDDLIDDIQSWWESVKDWFSDLGSTVTTVLKVVLGVILGVLVIWLISWIVKLVKSLVNSVKRATKKDKTSNTKTKKE